MRNANTYQASLFEQLLPIEPAVVLDIKQGRVLRDMGIEKAVLHAEQETPQWKEKAYNLLKDFVRDQHSPFMAESFRLYCSLIDFEKPPSNRAFGSVILKAAREKLIKKIGYGQVSNKKAHMANAAIWIKNKI